MTESLESGWSSTEGPKSEEAGEAHKGTRMYQYFEKDPETLSLLESLFVAGYISASEQYFYSDSDKDNTEGKWPEMSVVLNQLKDKLKLPDTKKNDTKKEAGRKLLKIRERE